MQAISMQKVCKKFAKSLQKVCKKYAKHFNVILMGKNTLMKLHSQTALNLRLNNCPFIRYKLMNILYAIEGFFLIPILYKVRTIWTNLSKA